MNSETSELRYTPLPESVPNGSPFRLDRAPNIIKGESFEIVHDVLFTLGDRFYSARSFNFYSPYYLERKNEQKQLFGEKADGSEMLWLWSQLAYAAMTASENDGVSWQQHSGIKTKRVIPILSRDFLKTRLKQFLQPAGNQTEDQFDESKINKLIAICDRGIEKSYWPISKKGEGYVFVGGPDMIYYLAALNFLSNHGYTADLDSLREAGLLTEEKYFRYGPFYSFLGENIFDYGRPEKFKEFIHGLSEFIGGDLGLATSVWEIKFLRKRDKITNKKLLLDRVEKELQEKYLYTKYRQRPAVVSPDTLKEAAAAATIDPPLFWQVIFEKEGVMQAMGDLFGENEDLRAVYETALGERKVIPASLMMIAEAMGLDREEAQMLAALSQFAWGMIVSYDNVIDGHQFRKGCPTQVATDGIPVALDTTMLGLNSVLNKTLQNRELHQKFLEMLNFSCKGDLQSRRLGWDDSIDKYLENMAGLVKAFGWFPDYIGKRTGLVESGQNFAGFLADLHTLGQLNNDIEDINPPPGKHEEGNDIGQRITLFWKILMDLPSNLVSEEEKKMIRMVFASRNGSQQATQEDLIKVLAIGRRCKSVVLASLEPISERIYKQAGRYIIQAFDSLPVIDERNKKYQMIFSNILETIR